MNRHFYLFLILFALQAVMGQESERAPVSIVTAPRDHMKWRMWVDVGSEGSSESQVPPNSLQNAWKAELWEFTRAGKLTQVFVTFGSGTKQEFWRLPGLTLIDNPHLNTVNFQSDGGVPAYPKACDGFYGIGQVKATDGQGKKAFEGRDYYYFRGGASAAPAISGALTPNGAAGTSPSLNAADRSWEAWFDLKTGLPKAFRQNGETMLFEFSPEVPGDMVLPHRFQAALDAVGTAH